MRTAYVVTQGYAMMVPDWPDPPVIPGWLRDETFDAAVLGMLPSWPEVLGAMREEGIV